MSREEHKVRIQGIFSMGPMSYEDYDGNYLHVFSQITEAIHEVLPEATVEHVGSTSISGLGGRKTLDIVIPAQRERHDEMVAKLLSIGFVKSPLTHFQPMLTGLMQYQGKDYPILLYIMPEDSEIYQGWMAFRTYMRQHPEEVQSYAAVKKRAIAEGKTNPWSYQQAKTPYLENLVKRMGEE